MKTYVTVHVVLACASFGGEAATDNLVPGTHWTLWLSRVKLRLSQNRHSYNMQRNAELHHDEARPGRQQDSWSMWCTEL